jgi:hypothetical protein
MYLLIILKIRIVHLVLLLLQIFYGSAQDKNYKYESRSSSEVSEQKFVRGLSCSLFLKHNYYYRLEFLNKYYCVTFA